MGSLAEGSPLRIFPMFPMRVCQSAIMLGSSSWASLSRNSRLSFLGANFHCYSVSNALFDPRMAGKLFLGVGYGKLTAPCIRCAPALRGSTSKKLKHTPRATKNVAFSTLHTMISLSQASKFWSTYAPSNTSNTPGAL